jgi:hypothetical protein
MYRHAATGLSALAAGFAGLALAVAPAWTGAQPVATVAGSPYRIEQVRRVVAFADVHGAYDELLSLLRAQGLVDEALRWSGADTHLVSLGDLLDRGPSSRQVLELLMRLEVEARAEGGAVHVVLGNHEVMNITGDLRYVSAAEYAAFAGVDDDALREAAWRQRLEREPGAQRAAFDARYPAGWFAHRQAFSPAGRYGAWLLSKPFVLVVNDTAFAHGGLPPRVAALGLDEINRALHRELADYLRAWQALGASLPDADAIEFQERPDAVAAAGLAEPSTPLRALDDASVFTTEGPAWFRGQALCPAFTEAANLEAALAKLGAARVVVGHSVTPTRRVTSRFEGRVILLDTGMLAAAYQGRPSALVIEGGKLSASYADQPGTLLPPEPLPRAVGARPGGLDDDALEAWLAQAEIISTEELPAGVNRSQRVTLRRGGVELRAVLRKPPADFSTSQSVRPPNEAGRIEFEVAAYELDRLLGLGMVPVTVARTVEGRKVALQFWVEGTISARQMAENGLRPEGWCPIEPQYNLMNVFDVLLNNAGRSRDSLLLTRDWNVVLVDHSRAFTSRQRPPALLYQQPIALPPALAARLATLDRGALERELAPWLNSRQIEAILTRRDRLLREHGAVAAGGQP